MDELASYTNLDSFERNRNQFASAQIGPPMQTATTKCVASEREILKSGLRDQRGEREVGGLRGKRVPVQTM